MQQEPMVNTATTDTPLNAAALVAVARAATSLHGFGGDERWYGLNLLEACPDAGLIRPHRNPVSTLSYLASMVSAVPNGDRPPAAAPVERGDDRIEPQIIDITHAETVRDPIGTVERVYAKDDASFIKAHRTRLKVCLGSPPRGSASTSIARRLRHQCRRNVERISDYYACFGGPLVKS